MPMISQSVGDGGVNNPTDVRVVQRLLRERGSRPSVNVPFGLNSNLPPPAVNGQCDWVTIEYIREFQSRALGIDGSNPRFGIVMPESETLYALNGMSGGSPAPRPQPPPTVRRLVYREFVDLQRVHEQVQTDPLRPTEDDPWVQLGGMLLQYLLGDDHESPVTGRERRRDRGFRQIPRTHRVNSIDIQVIYEETPPHLRPVAWHRSWEYQVTYHYGIPQNRIRVTIRNPSRDPEVRTRWVNRSDVLDNPFYNPERTE